MCVCGHPWEQHEHYHHRTSCGTCHCRAYIPAWWRWTQNIIIAIMLIALVMAFCGIMILMAIGYRNYQ
jgi:hypothetical protein